MKEIKKRIKKAKYIMNHKLAIFKLWKNNNTKVSLYRVIMHDTIKLINVFLIGVKPAAKRHYKYVRHHNIKTNKDFYEAYLDWASARHTKKDKQLDAIQTAEKFYPHLIEKCRNHFSIVKFK